MRYVRYFGKSTKVLKNAKFKYVLKHFPVVTSSVGMAFGLIVDAEVSAPTFRCREKTGRFFGTLSIAQVG